MVRLMLPGLPPRLPVSETRFLSRGLLVVMGVAIAGVSLWWSPWSPAAVERPAMLATAGFPNLALDAYVDLAHGWATEDTRAEALWRAGNLAAVDLRDPQRAVELFRELASDYPANAHTADARARLATLYALHLHDPLRAAESWEAAAAAGPDGPEAGERLLNAGLAFAEVGLTDRAELCLRGAAERPSLAVDAWLALGRVRLKERPAEAYAAYDAALRAGASGDDASLARLGLATALERMDRLDAALAELDEAAREGDDDDVLRRRRNRLRSRSAR